MEPRKNILVTGGAGFIGSHTVVELLAAGYNPIILDDLRNAESDVVERIEQIVGRKVEAVYAACQDEEILSALFESKQFHGVIHFAADKAVGESVKNPLKYYENNIGSLVSILKQMEKHHVPNLVFSSSCTVYGNPSIENGSFEVTEQTPTNTPQSPYGFTKWVSEQMLKDWKNAVPFAKVIALRYFNPIGAHPTGIIGEMPQGIPNNLLPFVTQTALGIREKLTVFGNSYDTPDGTCIRDYVHVCDLADAHVKALDWLDQQTKGLLEVFNVGTGKGSSVLEVIDAFESISNQQLNWEFGPIREGDVPQIFANVEKVTSTLQWKAKFTMKDAVKDAWNWEQKQNLRHAK